MGRTRLFHTIVIVGSSLLANCEKGPTPVAKKDAGTKDATAKVAPNVPMIDAAVERPRIMAETPDPPMIQVAPPPPKIQAAPPPPRIQVRRKPKQPPPFPRI